MDTNEYKPESSKICWGCDTQGHLRRDYLNPQKKCFKNDQSAQGIMGASNATEGQQVAVQSQTQSSDMLTSGSTVVRRQATGAKVAIGGCVDVLVHAGWNAIQGVGGGNAQADEYMPALRAPLAVDGSEYRHAGRHVDARECWTMADLSIQGSNFQTVCLVKTILNKGQGTTAISQGIL